MHHHDNVLSLFHRRRMQRLGPSKIVQVDFLPKELVSYCKETQTPLTAHLSEGERERESVGVYKIPRVNPKSPLTSWYVCVCVCVCVCIHAC